MKDMIITSSPHVHTKEHLKRVMYDVVIALIPATLVSSYYFGLHGFMVVSVAVIFAILSEWLCLKIRGREDAWNSSLDGSAIITGLLVAMNIPPTSPLWMAALGSAVAVIIAKQTFGGLGYNIFNPALVARVFLLISFPVQMTRWTRPTYMKSVENIDEITTASPLGLLKTDGLKAVQDAFTHSDFIYGTIPGSLGEVSALALLLGAAYMLYRKVITWEIPASFLGALFVFTGIFWMMNPEKYADPVFHLFTGGAILGAFYMATDMVTSPLTRKGMLIFGASIGLLTGIIRLFGGYPEGVAFSILIMNAFVPIIDRYTEVEKFGNQG